MRYRFIQCAAAFSAAFAAPHVRADPVADLYRGEEKTLPGN
jgi:hypothetical protein